MYYKEYLEKIVTDKKNPVNRMYLHEIMLKWKNFEKIANNNKELSIDKLVATLNEFISAISNKKYRYNPSTKNGFKQDSPVFSSRYLDDLLSILIKSTKIFENTGISWGYNSFSTNLRFNPKNLCTMSKNPMFEFTESNSILHLAQKIDFQLRITNTRRFHKHQLVLPLLLFFNYKNLTEKDFITIEYYTVQAKATFEKSKAIIITETIEDSFKPDLMNSPFDAIFVLRKQYRSENQNEIQADVVKNLYKKIRAYCTDTQINGHNFNKSGIIESYNGSK